jgi:hypothetical protein
VRTRSLQTKKYGHKAAHQIRKVAGIKPAIGWTGQVRFGDDHGAHLKSISIAKVNFDSELTVHALCISDS